MSLGKGLSLSVEFTSRLLLFLGEEGMETSLFLLESSALFLLVFGLTLSLTLVFLCISDGTFLVTDQIFPVLLGISKFAFDGILSGTTIITTA